MSENRSVRRWVVLAIASLIIFLGYFAQYQISALAYLLMPQMGLTTAEFSNLMFTPMLTAMFLSIPIGSLADRFGTKRVVGTCLSVAVIGAFARCGCSDFAPLVAAGMVLGLAPASMNANYMRLFGIWFGRSSGIAICVYYAASGLGAVAAMMTATLFETTSNAFLATAMLLAGLTLLWWIGIKDASDEQATGRDVKNAASFQETVAGLRSAMRHRAVWIVTLITGLGLAAKSAYLGFLPQTFAETLSAADANSLASLVAWGGIVGCALGPAVCFNHRHPRAFVCTVNSLAAMAILATPFTLASPNALLLFSVGLLSSLTAPMVEAVPAVLPELRQCMGSVGGVVGTASLALSYAIPLAITTAAGNDYAMLLVFVGICLLITVPFLVIVPGLELASDTKSRSDSEG